jgi:hypothetical protein
MNVFQPLQAEAIMLCDRIKNRHSAVHNEHKCVGKLMLTARIEKIRAVQRIYTEFVVLLAGKQEADLPSTRTIMVKDIMLFAFTYAYDPLVPHYPPSNPLSLSHPLMSNTNNTNNFGKTVCFFGELDLRTLLLALGVHESTRVLLIAEFLSRLDLDTVKESQDRLKCRTDGNYSRSTISVLTLEQFISLQKSTLFGRVCDIVHVVGGPLSLVVEILKVVDSCAAATAEDVSTQNVYDEDCSRYLHATAASLVQPTRVVWESYQNFSRTNLTLNRQTDNRDSILHSSAGSFLRWDASLPWAVNTQLDYVNDPEGAPAKKYGMYLGFEHSLVDVWMGSVITPPPEVKLPTDVQARKSRVTFIISYNGDVFAQNADAFKKAMQAAGYTNTVVIPDITIDDVLALRQGKRTIYSDDATEEKQVIIQLVFGVFEPSLLLPHYIAVETEQICALEKDIAILHRFSLTRASFIFSFSESHKRYLRDEIGLINPISVVPFYTQATGYVPRADSAASDDYDIDILYFGGVSDRRAALWPSIERHLNTSLRFSAFAGTTTSYLKDEERDLVVTSSKVVINFHGCEPSSLALHRINYLLGMGKCIVSERSLSDPQLDAAYEGAVVFVNNVMDLFIVAEHYVRDDNLRSAIEKKARAKYETLHADVTVLSESLDVLVNTVISNYY